jgi:hypothetical protein
MSVSIRLSDEAYNVVMRVASESRIPLKRALEIAVLEHYSEQNTLSRRVAKLEDEVARLATRDALRSRVAANSRS